MTSEEKIRELEARIARLERLCSLNPPLAVKSSEKPAGREGAALHRQTPRRSVPPPLPDLPSPTDDPPPTGPTNINLPDRWLAWVGMALVFLGVLFFLKLSMDRGWISPALRVFGGALASLTLVTVAELLRTKRPLLARTLGGGGVACGFGTMLAARLLYGMLSAEAAFLGLVGIAGAGLVLALRQNGQLVALFSTIGALLAPLILGVDKFTTGPLSIYACIVLLWAMAAYCVRAWRTLFYTSALGSWIFLLMMAALGQYLRDGSWLTWALPNWAQMFRLSTDVRLIQISVVLAAVIVSLAPIAAASLRQIQARAEILFSALMVPLASWAVMAVLWNPGIRQLGYLALSLSVLYLFLGFLLLYFRKPYFQDYFLSAGLTAMLAASLLLGGYSLLSCYAALLITFNLCGLPLGAASFRRLGHVIAVILATLSAVTLLKSPSPGLMGIASVAFAVFALVFSAGLQRTAPVQALYRLSGILMALGATVAFTGSEEVDPAWTAALLLAVSLVAFLLWQEEADVIGISYFVFVSSAFVVELGLLGFSHPTPLLVSVGSWILGAAAFFCFTSAVGVGLILHVVILTFWSFLFSDSSAPQWTSIGWAIYAMALFGIGISLQKKIWLGAAWSALGVTLFRLFTVDLAELDMLWRSIVFIGIGALLLATVYFLPSVTTGGTPRGDDDPN